jgi:hypothetical protein
VERAIPLAGEPPALIDCCFAWLLTMARHGTGRRSSPTRFLRLPTPAGKLCSLPVEFSYLMTNVSQQGCGVLPEVKSSWWLKMPPIPKQLWSESLESYLVWDARTPSCVE